MKLHEIISRRNHIEWGSLSMKAQEYRGQDLAASEILDANGKIHSEVVDISISANSPTHFTFPFEFDVSLSKVGLYIGESGSGSRIVLDDMTELPSAKNTTIFRLVEFGEHTLINSLKGIEDVEVEVINLYGELDCGLLRLMKCQKLKRVNFDATIDGSSFDTQDNKAIAKILTHHLSNGKNVVECQSDLIDAGFEELAEL